MNSCRLPIRPLHINFDDGPGILICNHFLYGAIQKHGHNGNIMTISTNILIDLTFECIKENVLNVCDLGR